MVANVLFVTSCDDGTLSPTSGDSITLSTDRGIITDGRVSAASGTQLELTVSLGPNSTEEISVKTSNPAVASLPNATTLTSGSQIIIAIGGSFGDEATLTFSGGGVTERLVISVGYNTVADAALATSNLSTLAAALQEADLLTTLQGSGPFTVFAPTNDAFAALAAQLGMRTGELLARSDLEDILLYHVINGQAEADDLDNDLVAETATNDGLRVVFARSGNTVMVNDATITIADIETGNGIVHIIDKVLLPQRAATYDVVLLTAPLKDPDNVVGTRTSKTFFSADNGLTYSVEDVVSGASVTSADIDFGYYYGATNRASLASPAEYPREIYDLTSTGANWNDVNATAFRPVNNLNLDGFNAITEADAAILVQEYEISSGDVGQINDLAAGDLFAFRTVDNRYGVLRVLEIVGTDGSDGQISLEVKVTN